MACSYSCGLSCRLVIILSGCYRFANYVLDIQCYGWILCRFVVTLTPMENFTQTGSYQSLLDKSNDLQSVDIKKNDSARFLNLSFNAAGLFFDFSKQFVADNVVSELIAMAAELKLQTAIGHLFSGEKLNTTEDRPALHTLLRDPNGSADVKNMLAKMQQLARQLEQGSLCGCTQEPVTDIVHIGIGGSYLGPRLVYDALKLTYPKRVNAHFVANIDEDGIDFLLRDLNPKATLVIVVSKSFSTYETLKNAKILQQWMQAGSGVNDLSQQFFAITANVNAATEFGIISDHILPMWDWVGGRFSVCSSVGLVLAFVFGMRIFEELLAGSYAMDQHFKTADLACNVPVLMALIGVWNSNFLHASTQAIIPYADALASLPDYMQQLHMESLGKRVDRQGNAVAYNTGSIIFGGVGTNTQHSFHQLLMQGTRIIPVDFILPLKKADGELKADLVANCLAQSQAMWCGFNPEKDDLYSHRLIPGCMPSTTICCETLNPHALGALLALYEHKVFVQSVMWGINAFDQWGVECGKHLAENILSDLHNKDIQSACDASTFGLLQYIIKGD